jgi:hypothetical protein
MRSFLVLFLAVSFISTAAAQTVPSPSRWTLSAGPSWRFNSTELWGMRFRANYDLIKPYRPLQLRLEVGGLWGPTHSFLRSYTDGPIVLGQDQTVDLAFGLSASLSPLPRARLAPYVTFGVLARQVWSHGWEVPDGPLGLYGSTTPQSVTFGEIVSTFGFGVRARLGGRPLEIEYRILGHHQSVTIGTRLPF